MSANAPFLTLADRVAWINTPQLPELTPERQSLVDAYNLILEARLAMDRTKPEAERFARQRAWLIKTDPIAPPAVLGGEGAP